ncbi:MAG TPA: ADP-ribosylglycohydrolase family protein [Nocardioidaceae bacterium]|nr:ADP-ribosylglycohydrolase family protein [Nocardioidaceae bacterium]
MSELTWVQLPDLVAHELVASADEGKDVADIRARWAAAGGVVDAPAAGRGPVGDGRLWTLAGELLDDLAALPAESALAAQEPTELTDIEALAPALSAEIARSARPGSSDLRVEYGTGGQNAQSRRRWGPDRLMGAWLGRAAGCLLGKPVEKIPREGIREILQSQDRWPLTTWFTAKDLPDEVARRWPWNRRSAATSLAENIAGMPEDDDLNYALIALSVLERHGPDFTSRDVATEWLASLPGGRVFTAERIAYRNLLLGMDPPETATYRNPYREWIGAQIRGDVYGWVNPGDPAAAARMAWRDATVSHVRSGVYGAMFVAAMCASAVVADGVDEAIEVGLSVIPPESRYAAAVRRGVELGRADAGPEAGFDAIYVDYGHLHWVHVLNNACLVAYALTRSRGDFSDAIRSVVMGGWDTDSNGATVGSVCGALAGARALPPSWVSPLRNRLASSVPGFDGIGFDALTDRTLAATRG